MSLVPLFLQLGGRRVLVVGGGAVALEKATALHRAGADVHVVSPSLAAGFADLGVSSAEREFEPSDVEGAWLVIAAATPEVNRTVRRAADAVQRFVVAVDDTATTTAFGAAVVERGGVTLAISSGGRAPALVRLLREALERVLPDDLDAWLAIAERERVAWKAKAVPFPERRRLLFDALRTLYDVGGPS